MIEFRIKKDGKTAIAIFNKSNPDAIAVPRYLGHQPTIEAIKTAIASGYGMYGHLLNPNSIAAIDFLHAIRAAGFNIVVFEGQKLIDDYRLDIPEGAVT